MLDTDTVIHTSAPGKVILCGEYSVLESWPALVLAVNRRVHVRLQKLADMGAYMDLSAPGLLDVSERLVWIDNQLPPPRNSCLAMAVWMINELMFKETVIQSQAWSLSIDSRELFDGEDKLGLGSSAALTVALDEAIAVCRSISLDETLEVRWRRLHEVHSKAQGKQGSGVDIAASLMGGVCVFKSGNGLNLQAASLPDLNVAFIWSGASAATPQYLQSLSSWRQQSPDQYQSMIKSLGQASDRLCQQVEVNAFVKTLKVFSEALHRLAQHSQLPIFAHGHEMLYSRAQTEPELVYKPCGAGGGDLGILVSSCPQAFGSFISTIEQRVVDLAIEPRGAVCQIK